MILRKKKPLYTLAIGQIAMVLGIILVLMMRPLEAREPMSFMTGFLTGLSGTLLGLSIVLNLSGMLRLRKERANSRKQNL